MIVAAVADALNSAASAIVFIFHPISNLANNPAAAQAGAAHPTAARSTRAAAVKIGGLTCRLERMAAPSFRSRPPDSRPDHCNNKPAICRPIPQHNHERTEQYADQSGDSDGDHA